MDSGPLKSPIISNKDETLQLFAHPFLERLTHINPITLIFIFGPIAIYYSYLAIANYPISVFFLGFPLGVFMWTFIEYMLHRFVFHFHAVSEMGKKIAFLIHGVHHAYPRDHTRMVTPPIITVPVAVLINVVYGFIFTTYFDAIYAGTVFGYLMFDLLHYAVHRFNFKNRLAKFVKHYHIRHHYMDDSERFGVTIPLWDYVFGTKPSANSHETTIE